MKDKINKFVPARITKGANNLSNHAKHQLESEPDQPSELPRITNETVAAHREEVLKGARKYIYPLQHSKHRIVSITVSIVIVALISFFFYCIAGLYKFYQYNTFLYRVTQVVPFPIAHTDGTYIAYENYLFELRHYVHYYETQLQRNFNSTDDRQQLLQFRKTALQDVIDQAYVKQIAAKNGITVSNSEVDARITMVRDQNRLGNNNKVFASVLRDYWGWSVADFRRSLKQEILAEKVTAKLDTADTARAQSVLAQIQAGGDFAAIAKASSDDTVTKVNGGDYGFPIDKTNPNVPPQVIDALFKLQPGQTSGIINTGAALEIVKLTQISGTTVTAQHISINLMDINTYLKAAEAKQHTSLYVRFK